METKFVVFEGELFFLNETEFHGRIVTELTPVRCSTCRTSENCEKRKKFAEIDDTGELQEQLSKLAYGCKQWQPE